MSKLIIGNVTFDVLKQNGKRVLLSWTETHSGVVKERWVLLNDKQYVNIVLNEEIRKAA